MVLPTLTMTASLDDGYNPSGPNHVSYVTLRITTPASNGEWPAAGVALPSIRNIRLQNVKAVWGLPRMIDFGSGQVFMPDIDISNPKAPKLLLYKPNGTVDFDPVVVAADSFNSKDETITFLAMGLFGG